MDPIGLTCSDAFSTRMLAAFFFLFFLHRNKIVHNLAGGPPVTHGGSPYTHGKVTFSAPWTVKGAAERDAQLRFHSAPRIAPPPPPTASATAAPQWRAIDGSVRRGSSAVFMALNPQLDTDIRPLFDKIISQGFLLFDT